MSTYPVTNYTSFVTAIRKVKKELETTLRENPNNRGLNAGITIFLQHVERSMNKNQIKFGNAYGEEFTYDCMGILKMYHALFRKSFIDIQQNFRIGGNLITPELEETEDFKNNVKMYERKVIEEVNRIRNDQPEHPYSMEEEEEEQAHNDDLALDPRRDRDITEEEEKEILRRRIARDLRAREVEASRKVKTLENENKIKEEEVKNNKNIIDNGNAQMNELLLKVQQADQRYAQLQGEMELLINQREHEAKNRQESQEKGKELTDQLLRRIQEADNRTNELRRENERAQQEAQHFRNQGEEYARQANAQFRQEHEHAQRQQRQIEDDKKTILTNNEELKFLRAKDADTIQEQGRRIAQLQNEVATFQSANENMRNVALSNVERADRTTGLYMRELDEVKQQNKNLTTMLNQEQSKNDSIQKEQTRERYEANKNVDEINTLRTENARTQQEYALLEKQARENMRLHKDNLKEKDDRNESVVQELERTQAKIHNFIKKEADKDVKMSDLLKEYERIKNIIKKNSSTNTEEKDMRDAQTQNKVLTINTGSQMKVKTGDSGNDPEPDPTNTNSQRDDKPKKPPTRDFGDTTDKPPTRDFGDTTDKPQTSNAKNMTYFPKQRMTDRGNGPDDPIDPFPSPPSGTPKKASRDNSNDPPDGFVSHIIDKYINPEKSSLGSHTLYVSTKKVPYRLESSNKQYSEYLNDRHSFFKK